MVFSENSTQCAVVNLSTKAITQSNLNVAGTNVGENHTVRWANDSTRPYAVLCFVGLKLYRINDVRTASTTNEPATLIKDFTSLYSGLGAVYLENGAEGDVSMDGDLVPYMAKNNDPGGYY